MAEHTPVCDFGWKAPAFTLPGVDGKTHALEDLKGSKGTLVFTDYGVTKGMKAGVSSANRIRRHHPNYLILEIQIGKNHYDQVIYGTAKQIADFEDEKILDRTRALAGGTLSESDQRIAESLGEVIKGKLEEGDPLKPFRDAVARGDLYVESHRYESDGPSLLIEDLPRPWLQPPPKSKS